MLNGRGARRLRVVMRRVLHTADSPTRTAAAFSLGVFLGFSPFIGVHTALALLLAFALRLNRLAVLLGTFTLNPFTVVPIYGAGTTLGFLILGRPPQTLPPIEVHWLDILRLPALATGISDRFGAYIAPFLVGNVLLGAAAAAAAFPLSLYLVGRMRALRAARRQRAQAARG